MNTDTIHDKIENEGLGLCQVPRTRIHRPIALHGRLAFPFMQSNVPGTSRCEEGFGYSVELHDYRDGAALSGTVEASVDDSAVKVDTDQAEVRAGSKDGFDCLS